MITNAYKYLSDGSCVEVCPEIFEMREDVAVAKMEDILPELGNACREAAESCPVEAIIIED